MSINPSGEPDIVAFIFTTSLARCMTKSDAESVIRRFAIRCLLRIPAWCNDCTIGVGKPQILYSYQVRIRKIFSGDY